LYIVARSVLQGRRHGLASVFGVALGNLGNAVAATLGLAALFAVSAHAFTVVKLAGAAYLLWMGLQALRAPAPDAAAACPAPQTLRRVFRDGFVVALLNPKTTVFFAAFLPQFMPSAAAPALQSLVLGGLFVLMAAISDGLYALAAGALAPRLQGARWLGRAGRYAIGGTFIGLGLLTAISGTRTPKP